MLKKNTLINIYYTQKIPKKFLGCQKMKKKNVLKSLRAVPTSYLLITLLPF